MNHIELFAGCGGLSLGLESEGFDLLFANELSPMAAETFAFNHLGLNLAKSGLQDSDPVYWLNSRYGRQNIVARLKENPLDAIDFENRVTDLAKHKIDFERLRRSLIIGSILDLNKLMKDIKFRDAITKGLGDGQVDLVSGGPPCQSFSMAGMRQHSNQRNSLPWAFAEFVRLTKPRMALLENVTGILRAFNVGGEKYYAWYEIAKAFAVEGYVPICLHVNAKYVGAAQNRPRFIMLAFQKDIAEKIRKTATDPILKDTFSESLEFYTLVGSKGDGLEYGHLRFHDVENGSDLYQSFIFSQLVTHRNNPSQLVSVKDAIDDLRTNGSKKSPYVNYINKSAFIRNTHTKTKLANHELRNNSVKVKARFRLYQLMNRISDQSRREIGSYLRSGNQALVQSSSLRELSNSGWLMAANGEIFENLSNKNLLSTLALLRTNKQTQKALIASKPAPAALSIPDDACHYHDGTLRTLTVREMARIQSFPDWFEFRSKVTTGGQMRKFQVPQYTQVGNAVPPLLGKALGKVCKDILALGK